MGSMLDVRCDLLLATRVFSGRQCAKEMNCDALEGTARDCVSLCTR
jgi:hypothetical protein